MHLFLPSVIHFPNRSTRDLLSDHVSLSLKAFLWLLIGLRIKPRLYHDLASFYFINLVLGLLPLTTRFHYAGLPSVQ